MSYDREELIAIGERWHTESLLEWSGQIVQSARQDLPRLKPRGITEQVLREIETARSEVKERNFTQEREKKDVSGLTVTRRDAVDAALDWREEIRGLAKAVFDSDPQNLARFRTGVKTSRSVPKLITEIGFLLGATREHLAALRGVGVADAFLKRGEEILRRLEEAQRRHAEEGAQLPPSTADLFHAQGVLYTRVRFIVRVAEVEFHKTPDQLGRYSYAALRRQEAAAEGRRLAQKARVSSAEAPRT